MKNYRIVAPLLLIGFVILSVYTRFTEIGEQQAIYDGYLQQARTYREGKIYTDSMQQYQNALDMKLTLEVCKEVGEMLLEEGKGAKIKSWGEYLTETFPKEVAGYEYLVNYQMTRQDYEECFELYDIVQRRGLSSDTLTETINRIRYAYELDSTDYIYVSEYSFSYCYFIDEDDEEDNLYGYCDVNGKKLSKTKYLQAGAFGREYAAVQDETGEFYFIDKEGNRRLNVPKNIEITKVGFLSSNRYPVGTEGKMYYADLQGNLVLGPFEDVTTFNGQSAAVKENGLWYLIDLDGNKLTDGYLDFAKDVKEIIMRNNVVFAKTDKGYVCLDAQGKAVTKEYYEDARCFLDTTYTSVKINGKWGYIDNTGKVQIEPQFEDAKPFSNGLAAVKMNDLWGYIDSTGQIVIDPVFLDANSMNEAGNAFVLTDDNEWNLLELVAGI